MEAYIDIGNPKKHPWYGSELTIINNAELASIKDTLTKAIEAYTN